MLHFPPEFGPGFSFPPLSVFFLLGCFLRAARNRKPRARFCSVRSGRRIG